VHWFGLIQEHQHLGLNGSQPVGLRYYFKMSPEPIDIGKKQLDDFGSGGRGRIVGFGEASGRHAI
jgi:hypothetical protein